jgi:hypothetical protein
LPFFQPKRNLMKVVSQRERAVRGNVSGEHVVQLFDETESLVASVAAYLRQGWKRGDNLLIVARPAHWALTSGELEATGCPVVDLIASGRLVALDAATTMATFIVNDDPHEERFSGTVGDLVRRLAEQPGTGLTIYGEMVDILAAQGNFNAAERLEALWNGLSTRHSFRLLCGYSAVHFGDERNTPHLNAICAAHTGSSARATDLLASWLLANRRSRFHIEQQ